MRKPILLVIVCFYTAALLGGCTGGPEVTEVLISSPEPVATNTIAAEVATPEPITSEPEVGATPPQSTELENMTQDSWFSVSPNGEWTAQAKVAYPISPDGQLIGDAYYVSLDVFNSDGSVRWIVLDEWRPYGLGHTVPQRFHWSADTDAFFYNEHGIPDGCPTVFGYDCGLFRVDLQDGVLRDISGGKCSPMRASPVGDTYAELTRKGIQIWSAAGEMLSEVGYAEAAELTDDDWWAGGLLWAPDGESVIFEVVYHQCSAGGTEITLLQYDLATQAVTPLILKDERMLVALEWRNSNELILEDAAGQQYRYLVSNRSIEILEQR